MKFSLSKISLLAGIGLIAAGTSAAYAQCNGGYQCSPGFQSNPGYGGGVYYDGGAPTSNTSGYSWGPVYNTPVQGNSGYYDNRNYQDFYQPASPPVYGVSSQQECPCGECAAPGDTGITYAAPQSDIERRLSYIEKVLTFIISFLGLDDDFERSTGATAQVAPRDSYKGESESNQ